MTRRPALRKISAACSIGMATAMSISPGCRPARKSRTAPPTMRASEPASVANAKICWARGGMGKPSLSTITLSTITLVTITLDTITLDTITLDTITLAAFLETAR